MLRRNGLKHCQHPVTEIPIALVERHLQGIGVETQVEDTRLLQQPPHDSAASLRCTEPLKVCLFAFTVDFLLQLAFLFQRFLLLQVKGIVSHNEI